MLGVNGSYSQNGGWSGNYFGTQITQNGISFSPNVCVGVSLIQYYPGEKSAVSSQNGTQKTGEGEYGTTYFFKAENETQAYEAMDFANRKEDTEYGALILKKGLLVNKYGPGGTKNIWQGRKHVIVLGKHYVEWDGGLKRVYGHIHTHDIPNANYFSDRGEGGNDYKTILNNRNMLFFLMCTDEKGTFRSATASIREQGVVLEPLRHLSGYTVNDLKTGHLKLIPFSVNYKYYY